MRRDDATIRSVPTTAVIRARAAASATRRQASSKNAASGGVTGLPIRYPGRIASGKQTIWAPPSPAVAIAALETGAPEIAWPERETPVPARAAPKAAFDDDRRRRAARDVRAFRTRHAACSVLVHTADTRKVAS